MPKRVTLECEKPKNDYMQNHVHRIRPLQLDVISLAELHDMLQKVFEHYIQGTFMLPWLALLRQKTKNATLLSSL